MKSCSEDQCEWLLFYDYGDLSDLDIDFNFLKKFICGCNFNDEFLNKLYIKKHEKICDKKSKYLSNLKIIFKIW